MAGEAYRILLVEDEENIADAVKMNLELEGYHVTLATTGKSALERLRGARYDLCIMDVMLPGVDGFSITRTIRLENNKVPILFLTAKDASSDRVEGLRIGGDDYLVKPFNLEELLLRVEKLIVRKKEFPQAKADMEEYTFGANRVNFMTFEVEGIDGKRRSLSKREIKLLKLLIAKKGEVVSREEILETVWGYDVFPSTRTIDNYILAFRKYFENDPKSPEHFHSVRGVGYKFTD